MCIDLVRCVCECAAVVASFRDAHLFIVSTMYSRMFSGPHYVCASNVFLFLGVCASINSSHVTNNNWLSYTVWYECEAKNDFLHSICVKGKSALFVEFSDENRTEIQKIQ